MRSSRFPGFLAESLYSGRATLSSLSSSSANISFYCLEYATAKAEPTKNEKSKSDCFIWSDDEVKLLLKVCMKLQRQTRIQIGSLANLSIEIFWISLMSNILKLVS